MTHQIPDSQKREGPLSLVICDGVGQKNSTCGREINASFGHWLGGIGDNYCTTACTLGNLSLCRPGRKSTVDMIQDHGQHGRHISRRLHRGYPPKSARLVALIGGTRGLIFRGRPQPYTDPRMSGFTGINDENDSNLALIVTCCFYPPIRSLNSIQ